MANIDRHFVDDRNRINAVLKQLKFKDTNKHSEMTCRQQDPRIDSHWSKKRWDIFCK